MALFTPVPGQIFAAGNVAGQNAFDVIFAGIAAPLFTGNALFSHPLLEAWGNCSSGAGVSTGGIGDTKLFWTTISEGSPSVISSAVRAIATFAGAAPAGWADGSNISRDPNTYPTGGKCRVLQELVSRLPLFDGPNLLGGGVVLTNRLPFNLAMAVHANTGTGVNDLRVAFTIRYTFAATDPFCSVRANQSSTDTMTSVPDPVTTLSHSQMMTIAGADSAGVYGSRRIIFGSKANGMGIGAEGPRLFKPKSGFSTTDPVTVISDLVAVQAGLYFP